MMKSIDEAMKGWKPDNKFLDAVADHWVEHHVKYVPGLRIPGLTFYPANTSKSPGLQFPGPEAEVPVSKALALIKKKDPFFAKPVYDYLVELYFTDYKEGRFK